MTDLTVSYNIAVICVLKCWTLCYSRDGIKWVWFSNQQRCSGQWLSSASCFFSFLCLLSAASCRALADCVLSLVCVSVCLCVINVCKQDISKTILWIFAKFTAYTHYMLPWKWLIFGAHHFQDGWLSAILGPLLLLTYPPTQSIHACVLCEYSNSLDSWETLFFSKCFSSFIIFFCVCVQVSFMRNR